MLTASLLTTAVSLVGFAALSTLIAAYQVYFLDLEGAEE